MKLPGSIMRNVEKVTDAERRREVAQALALREKREERDIIRSENEQQRRTTSTRVADYGFWKPDKPYVPTDEVLFDSPRQVSICDITPAVFIPTEHPIRFDQAAYDRMKQLPMLRATLRVVTKRGGVFTVFKGEDTIKFLAGRLGYT